MPNNDINEECEGLRSNDQLVLPQAYLWLQTSKLMTTQSFGPLQPWQLLPKSACLDFRKIWPAGPHKGHLVAFAKRQDCDDYACFDVIDGRVNAIVLVECYTSDNGYDILCTYGDMWQWIRAIIDDVREWSEASQRYASMKNNEAITD